MAKTNREISVRFRKSNFSENPQMADNSLLLLLLSRAEKMDSFEHFVNLDIYSFSKPYI